MRPCPTEGEGEGLVVPNKKFQIRFLPELNRVFVSEPDKIIRMHE
jgi:hypothetical protein